MKIPYGLLLVLCAGCALSHVCTRETVQSMDQFARAEGWMPQPFPGCAPILAQTNEVLPEYFLSYACPMTKEYPSMPLPAISFERCTCLRLDRQGTVTDMAPCGPQEACNPMVFKP